MVESPRIYNLFPRLAGPLNKWMDHVARAKQMGFNWIYVNPVNYPGFSASLYATKDYYKLNPVFAPEGTPDNAKEDFAPFRQFVSACHSANLRVMVDLVINHTAFDSDLVKEHPDWYVHKWTVMSREKKQAVYFFEGREDPRETGAVGQWDPDAYSIEWRVANPSAIDPGDARKVTIWGDLAEIDNDDSPDRQNLWHYWEDLVDFYLDLGVDGFRGDAAYKLPADLWHQLIVHAKKRSNDAMFFAETLGCWLPQIQALAPTGFDFIFSSSKYWDFTAAWAIEQYNSFRAYFPSVSFPESHDTPRLAAETGGRQDIQIFRYLFAALFSAGTMMPIGYEYGFKQSLDVVLTAPSDWESPTFDLATIITSINNFKKKTRCLNEDGPIVHFGYGDLNILVLRKASCDEKQMLLLVYNKDWNAPHRAFLADMGYFLPLGTPISQLEINGTRKRIAGKSWNKELNPNEYAIFLQEAK